MNGPIASDRLRSFIERIERLIEERKGIQEDIRDVFSEAKGVGYDVKTMRKVIQIRAMDAADRDEQEALLETYLHALGMVDRIEARLAAGDSVRKAADAVGANKSTVHRVSQKVRERENGTATNKEADTSTAGARQPSEPSIPAEAERITATVNPRLPSGPTRSDTGSGQEMQSGNHSESAPSNAPVMGVSPADDPVTTPCASGEGTIATRSQAQVTPSSHERVSPAADEAANAGGGHDERLLTTGAEVARAAPPITASGEDDDLVIPHFLRRVPKEAA